jgi:UDP-glucose 4-epimerase
MKVSLITGATGFIGEKLLRSLDGEIKLLGRKKQFDYPTIICDLQSGKIPSHALNGVKIVFHLAGLAHDVSSSKKNWDSYYKLNVAATIQLANLAVKSGVEKFIFLSSVKAGGCSEFEICSNEEDQGEIKDIYGKTKREAELKLLEIGKESKMHVTIIRPSLVYGPSVKGNLRSMLSGIKAGWFPPLPEIGNKRSMIHVDDLVSAILLVADNERTNGEIYIATDGKTYSSRYIYDSMRIILKKRKISWSVPKLFFDIVSFVSPKMKNRLNKLFGNEFYSSAKLEKIGFNPMKSLEDMNETNY